MLVQACIRDRISKTHSTTFSLTKPFPGRQVATSYSHFESSALRLQGSVARCKSTAQQVLQPVSALRETQLRHACTNCVPSSAILAPVFLPLPLVALHSKNRNCARVPLHAVRMQQRPRCSARSAAASDLRRAAFAHIPLGHVTTCPSISRLRPPATP